MDNCNKLALEAGIDFIDSQWETLLESSYKKAKNELQPISGTTYTEDGIANLVKVELGKLNVSVNVVTPTPVIEP